MLDSIKIGHFISEKRKELKMTQQQLADKLKVSFQAVSKWSAYQRLFSYQAPYGKNASDKTGSDRRPDIYRTDYEAPYALLQSG